MEAHSGWQPRGLGRDNGIAYRCERGLADSAEALDALFLKTQSKGADAGFLLEFLKKNRQDALELKKGL